MATVANGGTRVTPHLLKAVDDGNGLEAGAAAGAAVDRSTLKPENAAGDPRRPVAGRERRRHRRHARGSPGRDVSGKTGTAQVISLEGGQAAAGKTDRDLRDHGWFVFFAPRDNPQIAGVIFAEHGEHGYQRRADRQARDRDLLRQEGRAAAAAAAASAGDAAADPPTPTMPPTRSPTPVADAPARPATRRHD